MGRRSVWILTDIIAQTDRTTLLALICTAKALKQSGITDPYELYKRMHPFRCSHESW
jgi:fatty acid synthase subunit alpha